MSGFSDTFLLHLELRKLPILCRFGKYFILISFFIIFNMIFIFNISINLEYLLAVCHKIWIWFNFLPRLLSNYPNIIHQRKCPHPRVLKTLQYHMMSLYLTESISGFSILFTAILCFSFSFLFASTTLCSLPLSVC